VPEPAYRKQSGPLIFLVVLAGFGVLFLLMSPMWEKSRRQSRYTECTTNLEMIAARQEVLHDERGTYSSCATWPPELPLVAAPWLEGPRCWIELGFERDVDLRGQYRVDGGRDSFTAVCWVDADEDGKPARFEATAELTVVQDPTWED
jgi:hypothetical protein